MAATTVPLLMLLVAMSTAAVLAWRAPGETRPNIVFFFPDTISAESMGAYGHPVTKTPNFDAFAAQGVLFEYALSSYPQCSPSRAALVTGRHPHGVFVGGGAWVTEAGCGWGIWGKFQGNQWGLVADRLG